MSLFQNSVLQNYLKRQDSKLIAKLYKKYKKYFHNPKTQENIRKSKEEQFQEGFLRELFVKILGYTINPDTDFNITTEFKNLSNAQKADGAILQDGKAVAVIELKGTKTRDLEKVRKQAFDYKANQPDCVYVITSNFERLRFYIDNAVEYEEFNLFTLSMEEFTLFYLCLSKESLLSNLPQKIKNESLADEKKITNALYNDYSLFKREMFRDLVKQNMQNEVFRAELEAEDSDRATKNIKQTLFKKSQKLIDRFLFIFFAEDRGLIPANSTLEILDEWQELKSKFNINEPLYNRFKNYFNYLDTGRKATATNREIFAYNGGLFKMDTVLDSLLIDNELLYNHTKKLCEYDFDSQVGVNVLGHIFENSLNEIESVNAEIEGVTFDKQKSKRKKDGVFYTPQYITRYIVESTVGKLCTEKKEALNIIADEYLRGKDGRQKKTIDALSDSLEEYRNWLLELTILDPACGSGAFLNEALEFLIAEHRYIDELKSGLYEEAGFTQMVLTNIENTILEKNIFGVDLNEESVEIAKLSLWLRSAAPRRKLNDLSSNIKCGNSLISVKAVAGDKAFVWEEEFPTIFTEKKKKIFHITTATHNSRYSQRMFDYHIKKGEPRWLSEEEELIITETRSKIFAKDSLFIPTFNICGDHMHFVLVCEEEKVVQIVGKIKAMTARATNKEKRETTTDTTNKARGHAPLSVSSEEKSRGVTQEHLWTQKFGKKEIFDNEQYSNTLQYICNNRKKHELPENKAVQEIVARFVCHIKDAMKVEYSGGFDVVIENPPYVRSQQLPDTIFIGAFVSPYTKFTSYLPKKLQNYHTLSFADFIKELNKVIKKEGGEKLTKLDEIEWMEVFEAKKSEAVAVQEEISRVDGEIDEMVFELYGLTGEEIAVVLGERNNG